MRSRPSLRLRASLLLAALALAACKREPVEPPAADPSLALVRTADEKAAGQLLSGFFAVENNSWRWTGKRFRVAVRRPPDAATDGTTLEIDLSIPPPLLQHAPAVTVRCEVAGNRLPEARYDKPGNYTLSRELKTPLASPRVEIACEVDPTYKPGGADLRELGIIVAAIGLTPPR
jgi:hypothetical protein